jgi:hypothetical protein
MNKDFGLDNLHNLSLGIIKYLLRFSFKRLSDVQKGALFCCNTKFHCPGVPSKAIGQGHNSVSVRLKFILLNLLIDIFFIIVYLGTMDLYKVIRCKW